MHEFEANDLLLVRAELFHKFPDARMEFMRIGIFRGIWIKGDSPFQSIFIAKIKPVVLAENVQSAISADGEKPSFEIIPDFIWVREVEFEEGILDDIARAFVVAIEDSCRVSNEVTLILVQRPPNEEGGFILVRLDRHVFTLRL